MQPRRTLVVHLWNTQSAKSRIEMLAPQPLHFRNVRLCYIAYTSSASLGGTRDVAANGQLPCVSAARMMPHAQCQMAVYAHPTAHADFDGL